MSKKHTIVTTAKLFLSTRHNKLSHSIFVALPINVPKTQDDTCRTTFDQKLHSLGVFFAFGYAVFAVPNNCAIGIIPSGIPTAWLKCCFAIDC